MSWFSTLFDPLVEMDPVSRKVVGVLAEKWEINAESTEFKMFLRKDVTFHNGAPLTAEDVAFSFDRACNDAELKKGSSYPCTGILPAFKESQIVDQHTIILKLKYPSPDFLIDSVASTAYMGIVPKAAVLAAGSVAFGENPIGTGAYKFVEWKKGDHITVERNPAYKWGPSYTLTAGRAPLIDRIIFKYVPDAQTRVSGLQTGEFDGIDNVPASANATLSANPNVTVTMTKYNGEPGYLWLNTAKGVFTDVNVRRAMSAAVDREAINKSVYFGLAVPTAAFLTEGLKFADTSITAPPYNPAKANDYLTAAGYTFGTDGMAVKGGERLKVLAISQASESKILELVQAQAKAVGIEMEVQVKSAAEQAAARANQAYDLNLESVGFGKKTAAVFNGTLVGSLVAAKGYTPSFFQNAAFDAAMLKASSTQDEAVRAAGYLEAQKVLADQVPVVPFLRVDRAIALKKNFSGVDAEAAGPYRRFWDVRQLS